MKRLRYQRPGRMIRSKRKALRLAELAERERRACAAEITGNAGSLTLAAVEKVGRELRIMLQYPREQWCIGDVQAILRHTGEAAELARRADVARQRASRHLYQARAGATG